MVATLDRDAPSREQDATRVESRARRLRRAFRKQVLQVHPDLIHRDEERRIAAETLLKKLIQSYELERRRCSDVEPALDRRQTAPSVTPAGAAPATDPSSLPGRPLALGQVLCHLGFISTTNLFAGLQRQRQSVQTVGALAVSSGLMAPTQVRTVLMLKKPGERFGACAKRLRKLSEEQVVQLLALQRRARRRLGTVLVESGMISRSHLQVALHIQRRHNQQVGWHHG